MMVRVRRLACYIVAYELTAFLFPLLGAVMVRRAQRLIPEQRQIASVRSDVIDHSSGRDLPLRLAHTAARIPSEVQLSGITPSPPVKLSSRWFHGPSQSFAAAF
jgi:hypothetical protein